MLCGIYKITCTANGKFYIGSSKEINKRWYMHMHKLSNGNHENDHLQRAWNKYGADSFQWDIIEDIEESDLLTREQYHIDFLKSFDPSIGFNIGRNSSGGDNLSSHPNREEIIKKIREATIRRYENMSQEEKDKYKESMKGENNPNYGKRWNKEQRNRMSKYRTGKKATNEARENMSKSQKAGWTEEKRALWSESTKGNKNNFYGKKHSDEFINKMSKMKSEKHKDMNFEERKRLNPNIRRVEIDGTEYDGVAIAAKKIGVCPATIVFRMKSKNPKYNGYRYID